MTAPGSYVSQAPQAVRSARSIGWNRVFPSTATASRALHSDKCDALGLATDVHRLGNVSGTAAARTVLRIHSSPSVATEFFIKSRSRRQKVNCVTKHEHELAQSRVCPSARAGSLCTQGSVNTAELFCKYKTGQLFKIF
jgi:hypothetical protein